MPNAFALPGGKIYLLNGLLQKAQNADELAGVLAHETNLPACSRMKWDTSVIAITPA
ncbi:MAG TPA: M48 family metalloprotease [Xanthobacteraceae bacterium]|nr:M48 family metalloprotease [Xanthobacteraceae bacterium]